MEGDATSHYLAKRLARKGLKISRIAYGLPAGSGLEFADELTLSRALEGRREDELRERHSTAPLPIQYLKHAENMTPFVVFDLGKVLVDFDYYIAIPQHRRAQQTAACRNQDLPATIPAASLITSPAG